MMKMIKVQDAVGSVLSHDVTQIIPGEFKGRAFKKGHIIKEEDIEKLLSIGKDHVYVWEPEEGQLHENDAAIRLSNLVVGEGVATSEEIKEGKVDFFADRDGVLKIDKEKLFKLNSLGEIIVSTLHNNTPIRKGEKIGATRVIPLIIDENKIIEILKENEVELVILAGYLKIVSPKLVNEYRNKIINIHPSLIPAFCGKGYYGEKVHQGVIDYGAKVTGATVHFVDEGADTGPIIMQKTVEVKQDDDAKKLAERVLEVEHEILTKSISMFCENKLTVNGRRVYIND